MTTPDKLPEAQPPTPLEVAVAGGQVEVRILPHTDEAETIIDALWTTANSYGGQLDDSSLDIRAQTLLAAKITVNQELCARLRGREPYDPSALETTADLSRAAAQMPEEGPRKLSRSLLGALGKLVASSPTTPPTPSEAQPATPPEPLILRGGEVLFLIGEMEDAAAILRNEANTRRTSAEDPEAERIRQNELIEYTHRAEAVERVLGAL